MTKTMDGETFKRIKKILTFVWLSEKSSFYRDKYKKAGFSDIREVKTADDFFRLPLLTRDELASTNPFDRLYTKDKLMLNVTTTSGTTLKQPVVTLQPLIESPGTEIPRIFRESSRLLILNQPMRVAGRLARITGKEKKLPITILAGDSYNLTGTAYLAGKVGIDSVNTTVSLAISFAEILGKHYDCRKIRFMRLVGELITDERSKLLRKLYPKAKIHAVYGQSEVHSLGRLCGYLTNTQPLYHINPNIFYEIVDGELVITNLDMGRTGTPLVRYKTGDAIEWTRAKCACGRSGRLFYMLGRVGGDFIKVAGGEIWGDMVEMASARFPEVQDLKLHVYEERVGQSIKPRIVFEVIPKGEIGNTGSLAKRLAEAIPVSPRHNLLDAKQAGHVSSIEVRTVSSMPRTNKPGSIIFHGD